MKQTIREFGGKIIGYYDTQPNGDIIVTDFYGRKLEKYTDVYVGSSSSMGAVFVDFDDINAQIKEALID